MSGTSMAAPHISGLVALLYSRYPDITPSEVREKLQKFVIDKGALNKDDFHGYGMPDSYAVLNDKFDQLYETKVFVYQRKSDSISAFSYPNRSGNYIITNIQPGNYSVCAFLDKNMNGYVDTEDKFGYVESVTINAGMVTENINLELLSPQETGITIEEYLTKVLP
ncbi:MAG: S8 family serine peptidase [Firmicutes bacterium]|nr:S8 family serine peptidase [Bacillota bacterium]